MNPWLEAASTAICVIPCIITAYWHWWSYNRGRYRGRREAYALGLRDGAVTICVTAVDARRVPVERLEPSRN